MPSHAEIDASCAFLRIILCGTEGQKVLGSDSDRADVVQQLSAIVTETPNEPASIYADEVRPCSFDGPQRTAHSF
jgi:hypothetical protein